MLPADVLPSVLKTAKCLFLASLFLLPRMVHAADAIPTAEAALARFRTACEGEIMKGASADHQKLIQSLRESPFLMVARKAHVDIVDFIDPKVAAAISKSSLYGSYEVLKQSTGDVWVLTYGNMNSLTIYLDAASGSILCVAYILEG
jgi:hypothetical protein